MAKRKPKPIRIQRVCCPVCGVTHALLPCIVMTYSRFLTVIKEAAIKGIVFEGATLEALRTLLH